MLLPEAFLERQDGRRKLIEAQVHAMVASHFASLFFVSALLDVLAGA